MPKRSITIALLAAFVLSGCALTGPFGGPGYDSRDGVTLAGDGRLLVVVTEAALQGDGHSRSAFWDYVEMIEEELPDRSGLVGYSLSRDLLGNKAWTMTVWSDEASMSDFVESDAHQGAIRASVDAVSCSRFARIEIARAEVPISWDQAMEALDRSNDPCE